MYDVQATYELYVGMHTDGFGIMTELQRLKADVNGDGTVNMQDVEIIRQLVLRLITVDNI